MIGPFLVFIKFGIILTTFEYLESFV